jgi:hypothetical protein
MMYFLFKKACKELEGKFNCISRITGTRMLIIDTYVSKYKNKGNLEGIRISDLYSLFFLKDVHFYQLKKFNVINNYFTDRKFSVFRSEYDKLLSALDPICFCLPISRLPEEIFRTAFYSKFNNWYNVYYIFKN